MKPRSSRGEQTVFVVLKRDEQTGVNKVVGVFSDRPSAEAIRGDPAEPGPPGHRGWIEEHKLVQMSKVEEKDDSMFKEAAIMVLCAIALLIVAAIDPHNALGKMAVIYICTVVLLAWLSAFRKA